MKPNNGLVSSLDAAVDQVFGAEKARFSPVFITPLETITGILNRLQKAEKTETSQALIAFWEETIVTAYRLGIYHTAKEILEDRAGKINSFVAGEETGRERQIAVYEKEFNALIKNILT